MMPAPLICLCAMLPGFPMYFHLSFPLSLSLSLSFFISLKFLSFRRNAPPHPEKGEYKSHSLEIFNLSDLPALAIAHVVSKVCLWTTATAGTGVVDPSLAHHRTVLVLHGTPE